MPPSLDGSVQLPASLSPKIWVDLYIFGYGHLSSKGNGAIKLLASQASSQSYEVLEGTISVRGCAGSVGELAVAEESVWR